MDVEEFMNLRQFKWVSLEVIIGGSKDVNSTNPSLYH